MTCSLQVSYTLASALTDDGPKVVEYNVRFGDPEAQVVLPQLQSDFYELILALLAGEQPEATWQQDDVYAGVVLVNPSYPAPTTEHIVPTIIFNGRHQTHLCGRDAK